jgi:preprotein translocase subunit SecE
VARDRKRAKQRRARTGRKGAPTAPAGRSPVGGNPPAGSPTDRGSASPSVPGALDHASGDVDEFDAAIVRGAGGAPVAPDASPAVAPGAEDDRLEVGRQLDASGPGGGSSGGGGAVGGGGSGGGGGVPDQPSGAPLRGGNRAVGFVRASWAELQRVQWPDRRQVFQATAVVLGFVAIAGAYLGLADFVAKEIVEFILG